MAQSDLQTMTEAMGSVVFIRDTPVMLDFKVAEAFEVKTGALNQAVTRNKKKFSKVHAFRLTRKEAEDLRSQGVIPKRTGRGGTTKPPMAYTQKGVARLATVLTSPKALAATDLMIDVFTEIYTQVAHGIQAPTISNPGRLADTSFLGEQVQKLKLKLLDHLGALMDLPMPVSYTHLTLPTIYSV